MSFRLKTILGIAAIEIVLLGILVVSGLNFLRTSNETELLTRGQVTAQLFATMTSDAVVSLDLATLDSLVEQTLNNRGIVYVRVRQASGGVLSEGGPTDILAQPFVADASVQDTQNDGRLDVSYPIIIEEDVFGRIELGLSTQELEGVLIEARRWMLSIAATEIGLVALFGVLLGTVLTHQLSKLKGAAQRVAAGEFGHQLSVSGHDELAATTRSFNIMSKALADYARDATEARERAEAGQAYAETVLNDALDSMPQGVTVIAPNESVTF
ncbi:MAG: HAMP domain-containing protein, partial [Pseudomonadota bacterium]